MVKELDVDNDYVVFKDPDCDFQMRISVEGMFCRWRWINPPGSNAPGKKMNRTLTWEYAYELPEVAKQLRKLAGECEKPHWAALFVKAAELVETEHAAYG
jgi:hypothetical protein